eukprot:8814651-Pyramimonas_sp.AAC.1
MPSDSAPHVDHLKAHIAPLMATTQKLELEVRRLDQVLTGMRDAGGGSPCRRQRIIQLQEAGEEPRSEIQRVKLKRCPDLRRTKTALIKQRGEAENGPACARRHVERLEHN